MSITRLPTYSLAQARRIVNVISNVQGATLRTRSSKQVDDPSKAVTTLPDPRAVVDAFEDVRKNAGSGSKVVVTAALMEFTLSPSASSSSSTSSTAADAKEDSASSASWASSSTAFELSIAPSANDAPESTEEEEGNDEYTSFRIFDDYGAGSFVWGEPSAPDEYSTPLCDEEDYAPLISPSLAQSFTEWMETYEKTWDARRRVPVAGSNGEQFTEDWSVDPFGSDQEVTGWVVLGAILAMRMAEVVKKEVKYSAYLKEGIVFKGDRVANGGAFGALLIDLENKVSGWPSKAPK